MRRIIHSNGLTTLPAARANEGASEVFAKGRESQKKAVRVVLTDSGVGGAMTTALLWGSFQLLGAFSCLPIGQKPEQQAIAYTAPMALWPLIAPLYDWNGDYAKECADHVIIACNTASVRADDARSLISRFCEEVKRNPHRYDLPEAIKERIVALADRIESEPNYLRDHVHEIVSATATAAAEKVTLAFKTKKEFFLRIDSTNGTAESGSYQNKVPSEVGRILSTSGYTMRMRLAPSSRNRETVHGQDYALSHTIVEYEKGEERKTLYIESRGNPPWVPAIEADELSVKGADLAENSMQASRQAAAKLNSSDATVFRATPDLHMLCCTHYAPMEPYLPKTETMNQSSIVKALVDRLAVGDDIDDLRLAITIGSQNLGGVPAAIREGVMSGISRSVEDTGKTQHMLERVISSGRLRSNRASPVEVKIFSQDQDGGLQEAFERLLRFMALLKAEPIMREQGYGGSFESDARGAITWSSLGRLETQSAFGPLKRPLRGEEKIANLPEGFRVSLLKAAALITTGERRGIDKIAARVDVGLQFMTAVGHLQSVIAANAGLDARARYRVGILTGATVIDDKTGERKGGDNDGPPGAAILAKTLIERGTPVTLITDASSEEALRKALEALGGIEQMNLKIEIARRPEGSNDANNDKEIVEGLRARLQAQNVTTLIASNRPSVTGSTSDGAPRLFNRVGKDTSGWDMDMHLLLVKEGGWKPFTIGVGDDGNELGMGQAAQLVSELRAPNLDLFVPRGPAIAASPKFPADAMILAAPANTGVLAVAMALASRINGKDLHEIARDYSNVIEALFARGLSIDGVSKVNAKAVDGRPVGDWNDPRREPGTPGATHMDMMKTLADLMSDPSDGDGTGGRGRSSSGSLEEAWTITENF